MVGRLQSREFRVGLRRLGMLAVTNTGDVEVIVKAVNVLLIKH